MTRTRMRASRALVVLLVLALGIVLLVTTKKKPKPLLPASPALSSADNRPKVLLVSTGGPAVPVTIAPTTAPIALLPTTQPATQPAVAAAPTTRPAAHEPDVAPPIVIVRRPLEQARLKLATEPFTTRQILNEEMLAGHLAGAELDEARDLASKANEQVVFGRRVFRDDPHVTTYTVKPGDMLAKIAAGYEVSWELLCRINGIPDPRKIKPPQQLKVIRGPFHAVVSKSRFVMDLYLGAPGGAGSTFVTSYRVGLGKDDSTPIGTWKAERKLKNPVYYSPRGEGIIAADDPKNPLGEFWIGLAGVDGLALGKSSYGIHGTVDPTSIGREESMGCIRMRNEDVAVVFELLVEGKSTIIVRD